MVLLVNQTSNDISSGMVVRHVEPIRDVRIIVCGAGGATDAQFLTGGDAAIKGVAKTAVDGPGVAPSTTPHVQLDVPALLGTLATADGLGAANFEATSEGLLNAAGDGFLSDPPTSTTEMNMILEAASLSLVTLSVILLLHCRSRFSSYVV